MNKYRNVKITIEGLKFDSKGEASRWFELVMLQKAGHIRNLQRQVRIELQPKFVTAGDLVEKKVTIRAIVYEADYTYDLRDGDKWGPIIEDHKAPKAKRYSGRTKDYLLKKKMLLYKIANGEIMGRFIETVKNA